MGKMTVSTDRLTAKIVNPSIYEMQFKRFRPALSKNKESINFNADFEVIQDVTSGSTEFAGAFVTTSLNTKMETFLQDFVHSFGLIMEDNGDGTSSIPGDWINYDPSIPLDQQDPTKWQYSGPLAGRVIRAEVMPTEFQGRRRNEINRYICVVPQCSMKYPTIIHQMRMIR